MYLPAYGKCVDCNQLTFTYKKNKEIVPDNGNFTKRDKNLEQIENIKREY